MGIMNINERVIREKKYHDDWAQEIRLDDLMVKEHFESPTATCNQYILSQMGPLKGLKVLDIGCGAAESAVYFATEGAESYGCDVSGGLVHVARALAKQQGVEVHLTVAEAGKLPYPGETFDVVYGNGVLHHVDIPATASEVRRVLKKGGKGLFIEPLPYNPVINVYRVMAKNMRTEDERPITLKQLRQFQSYFSSSWTKEFWLTTLLLFLHFYLIRKWHPSKVRYWKKAIEVGPEYRTSFLRLEKCDRFLLQYLPFLRCLCWNTVIVSVK